MECVKVRRVPPRKPFRYTTESFTEMNSLPCGFTLQFVATVVQSRVDSLVDVRNAASSV